MADASTTVRLEPLVLVAGDTFKVKDQLKAIGGGTWCKPLGGWVFTDNKRAAIAAALDEAGVSHSNAAPGSQAATLQAASEAAASTAAAAVEASSTSAAGAVLTVAPHKKALLVTGDTKPVKDLLKVRAGPNPHKLALTTHPGIVARARAHLPARLTTRPPPNYSHYLRAQSLKGSWNKTLGGWVFPGSQRAALLEALRADPTNTVNEASASAAPPAKKQKKSAEDEDDDFE